MQTQSQSQQTFLCVNIDNLILKFIWSCKRPTQAKATLQKNSFGELILFDFMT